LRQVKLHIIGVGSKGAGIGAGVGAVVGGAGFADIDCVAIAEMVSAYMLRVVGWLVAGVVMVNVQPLPVVLQQ